MTMNIRASHRFLTWLLPAALLSGTAQARAAGGDTLVYEYPTEIVVTAPRISAPLRELSFSASVVDQNILGTLPRSVAIDEALKLAPGVKIDNQSNGNRVHLSIRGQGILTERGIRGIRILYDGIALNDPTGFAPDIFDVDFNTVERIEVLRGTTASLYGGSGSGGVVSILSQNAPAADLSGEANGSFGSNGFWKGFGQVGGTASRVNYRASFSRTMGEGYRDHTHFWGDNVYAKAIYTPTSTISLTPIVGWTHFYHENPEGITLEQFHANPQQANPDAIPFNEYLETERTTGGLTGLILFDEHHELQFSGYVKRTLFTEANNRTFNDRTLTTPGTSLQYTLRTGAHGVGNTLSLGTDLQWQTIDEQRVENLHSVRGTTLLSNEQIKQRGIGVFAIDKIAVGNEWTLMGSLRYDVIHNELDDLLRSPYDQSGSAHFQMPTARVGMVFLPDPDISLYANWGEGFLPPATEELAQNPDAFGGFNTHLVPATSRGVDLGVRGTAAKALYYDLTGFYLKTENDFDRYRISDSLRNQETFYRNAGSSRRFGLELFTRYTPVELVEVQLAYTFSSFRYTNSTPLQVVMDDPTVVKYIVDGNSLPNAPVHQVYLDCELRPLPGLRVGFAIESQTKTYIDGANVEAEAAPGYTLIHGRIQYAWRGGGLHGELSLQGRNLGNVSYVAFTEPDPGGNAYQPGPGREFFAALRIFL